MKTTVWPKSVRLLNKRDCFPRYLTWFIEWGIHEKCKENGGHVSDTFWFWSRKGRFASLVFFPFFIEHLLILFNLVIIFVQCLAMFKMLKEARNIWPCSLDQKGGNKNYKALILMPFCIMILIHIIDELKLSSSTSLTSDARGTDHNGSSLAQGWWRYWMDWLFIVAFRIMTDWLTGRKSLLSWQTNRTI